MSLDAIVEAVGVAPHNRDERVALYHADCLDILAAMPENSVDAVVTDPPYGLEFMGKEWDRLLVKDRHVKYPSCRNSHGPNAYVAGTIGQQWHQRWAEAALRVLKPGGHLVAFGGTRTHHRLWCALEDAGFEIRDTLMWLYGSGFPKSLDVSKAIDKAAGVWRGKAGDVDTDNRAMAGPNYERTPKGEPITDAARQWQGWGTALKPAWEGIALCRKPLVGTVAANVQEHGTGGLNVDGCRIGTDDTLSIGSGKPGQNFDDDAYEWPGGTGQQHPAGRWPANVVLECTCKERRERRVKTHWSQPTERDTSEGTLQCKRTKRDGLPIGYADPDGMEAVAVHTDPDCPAAMLDAQSGERRNGGQNESSVKGAGIFMSGAPDKGTSRFAGDSGGASRFFFCAKASRRERGKDNNHPTVKPLALMRWLCRLVTPPNGLILDPFIGSGTTALAAVAEGFRCIGIDNDDFYLTRIANRAAQIAMPL